MGLLDFLSSLFGGGNDTASDGQDAGDRRGSTDAEGRSAGAEEERKDLAEYGPEDFRAEAEEFAERHEDHDFDFSLASLTRLDEYAASQTEILEVVGENVDDGDALTEQMESGYVLWFGSYFGEVLIRAFDGEWRTDGEAVDVHLRVGDRTTEIPPFDVAMAAVHDEPRFEEAGAELRKAVGRPEDVADEGDDPETFRAAMRAEAEELVDFWSEYDLDYSPESLERLDEMVDEAWEKDRFADADWDGDRQVDRSYQGIVQQLGAYFGEVLVRTLDAEWTQDRGAAVEVHGSEDSATVNVFHVADDCLTEPSKFAMVYGISRDPDAIGDDDGSEDEPRE